MEAQFLDGMVTPTWTSLIMQEHVQVYTAAIKTKCQAYQWIFSYSSGTSLKALKFNSCGGKTSMSENCSCQLEGKTCYQIKQKSKGASFVTPSLKPTQQHKTKPQNMIFIHVIESIENSQGIETPNKRESFTSIPARSHNFANSFQCYMYFLTTEYFTLGYSFNKDALRCAHTNRTDITVNTQEM